MRNIIPLFLVMLMITTAFAAMDHQTLDEGSEIDNTSARSTPDMDVLAITTPSETTCALNGCRDTLSVGQSTEFKAVLRNVGDTDVTEMSYSVDIYLADSSGNRGMQATDSNGNPLSWTNNDIMCDDAAACYVQSLAPNAMLDNGQHTMSVKTPNGFEPITWTPIVGEYVVVISVDAEGDDDPGNDEEEIYVQVVNWQDVSIDISWKDGSRVATGDQSKDFSIAVSTDGSIPFTVRDVTFKLDVSGAVTTVQADDGTDLLANSGQGNGVTILVAGTPTTVTTFQEQDDANNTTSAVRGVLNYQDTWYYNGTVTPDGSVDSGSYTLEAEMESYLIYGQLPECTRTEQIDENNTQTYVDFCEVEQRTDDDSRNNGDSITGAIDNYHDIKVSMMSIAQGYNSDGTGNPDYFVNAGEDRDLRVGVSYLHATIEHAGSATTTLYDWNATFTVTTDGVSTTYEADSCLSGVEPSYMHAKLGDDPIVDPTASFVGYACVQVSLMPGEYTFAVEASMVDSDTFRGADQKSANNIESMELTVVNNAPTITSFSEYSGDALIVSQENPVELTVFAFDVDDISGDGLTYSWTWNGGVLPCGGQGGAAATCSFQILPDYMNNMRVVITVSDEHNAETSRFLDLEIWNDQVATASSDSGVTVEYAVQFFSTSNLTVTASDVSEDDFVDYEGVELPGFSGQYDAVAAVDFEPSNSYDGTAVLSQTLDVTVPKSLGATSMWYVVDNLWQLLDDSAEDVDASTDVYSFSLPDNTNTLRAGDIVFMGGALEQAQLPDASITGFSITPIMEAGGAFNISWSINGVVLDTDRIDLKICEGSADCEEPEYKTLENTKTSHVVTASKVSHDSTYFVEVAICNAVGCSSPIGSGSITVDSQIDGGAEAGAVIIQENGDNWDVTWVTYGDLDDVAGWKVCWSTTNFDSTNMPTNCEKFEGNATMIASIPMPTAAGRQTYYFAVVPYDEFGNSDVSDADNSIEYYRAVNIEEPQTNGTISDGSDGTGSGDLPSWALPAIGGVILVMVVIAAFILTRGGGGDNESKDWDY